MFERRRLAHDFVIAWLITEMEQVQYDTFGSSKKNDLLKEQSKRTNTDLVEMCLKECRDASCTSKRVIDDAFQQ